ncbi:putative disease resistance protein RGA4 isoform X2 [Spinacia oleracea]|nr:putative disease resistance protein RGA4 isoform X2 [Spinacia oleracea]
MNDADKTVESWLRNVVSILYNVEDMLDVLAYEKQRDFVMKTRPKTGKTRHLLWPLKRLYYRRKIGNWISRINTNIDEALKEAQTISQLRGLMHSPLPAATNIITSQGAAAEDRLQHLRRNVDMSLIVGRDSDVDSVVDKLCNPSQDSYNVSSNRLSVIAIMGIGGIGKTVLAKKVFEDKRVTDNFTERIWVVAPTVFTTEGILNKMVEYIYMSSSETVSSSEIAVRKLKNKLDGKKYLLVVDDVWDEDQEMWDATRSSLESIGGSHESMILVTTRATDVAHKMHAFVHHLPKLLADDSWSLFKEVAFANMSPEYISIFETTGKNIVEKCKGVPLAIKSIGGMLQTKSDPYEWEKIEQSEIWDLPQDGTGILPSLMLSYKHLSSPLLQKCFCFCATSLKSYHMDKNWLIWKWMALGLVQQSESRDLMEDIAEGYINALLSISFLHVALRDEIGEIVRYGMHDLVHDLATSVSKHQVLILEAGNPVTAISDVRHLAIYERKELKTECWDKDKVAVKNLRTLVIYKNSPGGLLKHVKYLRVLNLQDTGLKEVPESIAGLKCLKVLSLVYNPIKVLPEFITKWYNLQTLNLLGCDLLEEVPGGLSNLVNLRHLYIDRLISLPAGMIGQLTCLQTLPILGVREGGFQISELGGLPHISDKLEIRGLELIKSKQDAESASLSEKSRVKKLRLFWNNDNDWVKHEEVLDGLEPNRNLRLLTIQRYGGENFPSWLMRMDVIKIIELVNCRRCRKLPTLGHLPFLEKLKIKNMESLECIGVELYGASSSSSSGVMYFPSLKQVELLGLDKLTEWVEPSSGEWTIFPLLEELKIEDCPELKTTPYKFPSLEQLTVTNITTSSLLLSKILSNKGSLTCLKVVQIDGITEITHLPEELAEYCTSLQTLRIKRCQNLSYLPESLSKLISLELLQINYCPNLVSLSNLSCLGLLRQVDIFDIRGLTNFPEGLLDCKSLERLWFSNCPKVKKLPDLTGLSRLCNLSITSMTKMISHPPDWLYHLPCLTTLHIGSYYELDEFPDMSFLSKITSLKTLHLYGWEKLQSLPEQLQQFTTLKGLVICDFESMEYLPDWLGNLSSLDSLYPARCKNLKKLPTEDAIKRLTKLSYLLIQDCPLLEKAVKVNGTEHHKISNIKDFVLNII